MTGAAYATSARLAARLEPFAGYDENRLPMQDVLRRHRAALAHIEPGAPATILEAARVDWDAAVSGCEAIGVRNSQATVIAPTGTISFMMDCDTTGIEPDLGLVKFKKLVGGGNLSIVNQTVGRALSQLGYSDTQVSEIGQYILDNASIMGAPHLSDAHLPVFACSMGDNIIHHEGHVRMMAAVQPFVSGAISKTINLPEDANVAEVEDLHMLSWKLGLKAVAIYRDNCKVGQPLSTGSGVNAASKNDSAVVDESAIADAVNEAIAEMQRTPVREKLPRTRSSRTFSFRVADCHGYMTVGEYDDGRPGEIFLTVAKQGSTLAGIMDAFAISVSHGLQYGVPLRAYVGAFTSVRFEPAGITDDPELRIASSLVDYIVRRLALQYLPYEERIGLGVLATQERLDPQLPGFESAAVETSNGTDLASDAPVLPAAAAPAAAPLAREPRSSDAPMCFSCGTTMVRAGACHSCPSCGNTSGCG